MNTMKKAVVGGAIVLALGSESACVAGSDHESSNRHNMAPYQSASVGRDAVAAVIDDRLQPGTTWECNSATTKSTLFLHRLVGKLSYDGFVSSSDSSFCADLKSEKSFQPNSIKFAKIESYALVNGTSLELQGLTSYTRSNDGWKITGPEELGLAGHRLPDTTWQQLHKA